MAKKKILQDSEGQIWPVTVVDCVYLTDGSKTVKKYIDDGLAGKANTQHGHSNMVQGDNTSRTTDQNGNANDLAASGFYRVSSTNSTSNPLPDGTHAHILHGQHPSTAGYKYQIAVPYSSTNKLYFRNNPNSSWGSWNKIYHSGDKPTPADIGAAATSHGTHVSYGGNGSATTVSRSDHTHSYLPTSGGTITSSNFGPLTITRSGSTNGASIKFVNSSGTLGYIGMSGAINGGLQRWSSDTNTAYTVLDSGNYKTYVTPANIGAAGSSHGTHLTLGTGSGNAYYGDKGNTAYTHSQAAHAPSNAQKNSDITKAEIEAKLTGTITSHNHSGTYAAASHGNHVPTTQTANNAVFLRNDNTWQTVTPANIGAAAASHGTHLTIGTGASNAAAGNHTHNYAGSSSAGGAATSANKVNTNLIIKLNGGSTEGTNLFTFNGSTAKTINITPSAIGAAASSHGTHVSYGGNGSATTVSRSDHTHSYVPTAGGTMTGNLIMNNNVPIRLKNSGGTAWGMLVLNGSNNFHVGGGYQDNNTSVGNTYITAGGNMEYRVMSSGGCHAFYDNLSSGTARQIAELSSGNGFRLLQGSLYTMGGIAIGSSGASVHFNQGAGYVKVGSANPLYLQTTASDSSSTATEVRCSKVGANSTYIPLRAYNLNATNAVYAKGTNLSSDRILKENIKYISNANTINDDEITIIDCYNFIKDDLGLATYNYIDDPEKQQKIGFIAQDILYDPIKQMDNKIGQLIITKLSGSEQLDPDNPKLTYDVNNVLGVILGSLQVASKKIESLEATVENLTKKIESLESKSEG